MLPTPNTSHVSFENIYEPAEDSYLLLDTLSSQTEIAFLQSRFPSNSSTPLVLEVGTGSGVVLAFANAHADRIFGRSDIATIGIDVNSFACTATVRTVEQAAADAKRTGAMPGQLLGAITGDLMAPICPKAVDVLIFNPPYVPTESLPSMQVVSGPATLSSNEAFERDSRLLALSYAGGADGMETTNQLLAQLPAVLSRRGVAYVLLCAQNKPEEVKARIRREFSSASPAGGEWMAETVGSSGKQAGWEKLVVVRIWQDGLPT